MSFRAKWVSVNSGRTGLITKQRFDRVAIHGRFAPIHRLDTVDAVNSSGSRARMKSLVLFPLLRSAETLYVESF